MSKRSINAKRGLVWGWINSLTMLIGPFITRTILIYVLGIEYAGMNGLFTSIISVLNISELGFGSAISYLLYKPIADGDTDKIRGILKFSRKSFRIIGSIVLLLGIIIMPFLKYMISSDIPDQFNIYILYSIYLVNAVISYFLFSYKRILLTATQRYDIETNIATISLIIQYLFQIIVLILIKNYYIYVLVIPVSTMLNNCICGIVTKKIYPQYYCLGTIEKKEKESVKKTISGAFVSKIGATVFLSVDNIVISAIFGLVMVGIYGNYYLVISILLGFFAIIHNTLRPIVGNYMISNSKDEIYDLYRKINFIYVWAASACGVALLCLYQDFIVIWVGELQLFPFIMVILFTLEWYIDRLFSMSGIFIEAAGLWSEVKYIPLIATIVNLGLNIYLSITIGVEGVLISTIASSLLVTNVGYSFISIKHIFGKDKIKSWVRYQLGILIQTILSVGITYVIIRNVTINSWIGLFLKGFLTMGFFAFVFLVFSLFSKQAKVSLLFLINNLKKGS